MANEIVFPIGRYGTLSGVYGTNITQYNTYPNTTGFPAQSGMKVGEFGLLFDGTQVRLLKSAGGVNANDTVSYQINNGNDYTVSQLPAQSNIPAVAVNDRGGQALAAGGIAYMTQRGIASANVGANLTAPAFLASSAAVAAGFLGPAVAGTSFQTNFYLLNSSTLAGVYPVLIT